MRAVVFAGDGKVRIEDKPTPRIQAPKDAIVRVRTTAICGSDIHALDGKVPGMEQGATIGHEFVGEVADVGTDLDEALVGTRVLGSFLIACGNCGPCAAKRFNFCANRRALGLGPFNGNLDGAQADYVLVPDADVNLHILWGPHENLTNEQVLFAGDILATGFHAAAVGEVSAGEIAVVVGGGPVGLFCALAARAHGAARTLLLDVDQDRIDFARQSFGLEAINVGDIDAQAAVNGATEGALADVAFDAVGMVPAFKNAMKSVRDGGRVVVVGVYTTERYELPMGMVWARGLELRFSGMANVQAHWDRALDDIAAGKLDPTAAITHRLSLEDAEEGYELFRSRQAVKVVMEPEKMKVDRPPYRAGFKD
jgi:threonine dehydrogenase-like Zn-dependent dehydrogenase